MSENAQSGYVLVTPVGASEPKAIPTRQLHTVYENDEQTQAYLHFIGTKQPLAVQETLLEIWAQQNTDGNNLNMLLVTSTVGGRSTIEFTHRVKQISPEGLGSKIAFNDGTKLEVDEDLATIYAYQGAAINLGMVLVTRTSDGVQFIEMNDRIMSIDPYPETGVATGSIIRFSPGTRDPYVIDELPTDIYTNQPK